MKTTSVKQIKLEVLAAMQNKDRAQIHCGSVERFKEYLETQMEVKNLPSRESLTALYGIPICKSNLLPPDQVAMLVGNKLVGVFVIPETVSPGRGQ